MRSPEKSPKTSKRRILSNVQAFKCSTSQALPTRRLHGYENKLAPSGLPKPFSSHRSLVTSCCQRPGTSHRSRRSSRLAARGQRKYDVSPSSLPSRPPRRDEPALRPARLANGHTDRVACHVLLPEANASQGASRRGSLVTSCCQLLTYYLHAASLVRRALPMANGI